MPSEGRQSMTFSPAGPEYEDLGIGPITMECEGVGGRCYELFDSTGRSVLNGRYTSATFTMHLSNVFAGAYLLRWHELGNHGLIPLVKQ